MKSDPLFIVQDRPSGRKRGVVPTAQPPRSPAGANAGMKAHRQSAPPKPAGRPAGINAAYRARPRAN
jgi:hypothetical protein